MAKEEFGWANATPANDTAIPVVKNIFGMSSETLGELKTWLEQNPPAIPVSQIVGFNQFTFQPAPTIDTDESTTSTTFTDLATVGPTLGELSDGKYAIFFGAQGQPTSPSAGVMSVQVNSTAAIDADSVVFTPGGNMSVSRMILKTFTGGNTTLTAKYRSSGGDLARFQKRWLIVVRYSNI